MLVAIPAAALTLSLLVLAGPAAPRRPVPSGGAVKTEAPALLDFREFFEATPRELKPSARLLSLDGKRVRMVGFMARRLECAHVHGGADPAHAEAGHSHEGAAAGHSLARGPLKGAFYLCPTPTVLAEGGAGTGDLPPSAVLVVVPGAERLTLRYTTRALALVGRLELGARTESDGSVSAIRLILDPIRPPRLVGPPAPSRH